MTDDVMPDEAEANPTDLLTEAEELIATLTAHPDPAVGVATTDLLQRIDAVHRTALSHLMGAIQSMAGDAFVNRLTGDPAIRLLYPNTIFLPGMPVLPFHTDPIYLFGTG